MGKAKGGADQQDPNEGKDGNELVWALEERFQGNPHCKCQWRNLRWVMTGRRRAVGPYAVMVSVERETEDPFQEA